MTSNLYRQVQPTKMSIFTCLMYHLYRHRKPMNLLVICTTPSPTKKEVVVLYPTFCYYMNFFINI